MTKQYEVAVVSELLNQKLPFLLVWSSVGRLKGSHHTQRAGGWDEGAGEHTETVVLILFFVFAMGSRHVRYLSVGRSWDGPRLDAFKVGESWQSAGSRRRGGRRGN